MKIPFKKDPTEYNQRILFPTNIFDLLSPEHECYIYEDLINSIDTESLENKYNEKGQNAYHPRLIIGILIYAYSHGVFSSRQIEKRCKEDLGFMYISHMNCPNFRVISDFRKDNYEYFKESFVQSVRLAITAGLVSLGHISLDGSKFKADTSKHKAMSYKRLKEKEKELTKEIEELIGKAKKCDEEEDKEYKDKNGYEIPEELKIKKKRLKKIKKAKEALEKREKELNPGKEIEDKKQISFADEEARIMGKNGNFEYAYNGQISVDEKNQIIVGQHLSQNANDKNEVKEAIEQIEESAGKLPEEMSLDNGYYSGKNLEVLEEKEIDAYVATGKGEKKDKDSLENSSRKIVKSDFDYDKENDEFICPAGNSLILKGDRASGEKIYVAEKSACNNCTYKSRCCKSKQGNPRTIKTDDKEPIRQEMVKKMEEEESKEKYKKRKKIVEPVFGQIKKNIGFREFRLRGHTKTSGEFSLVCMVYNVKKIVKSILKGEVGLKTGNLVQIAA